MSEFLGVDTSNYTTSLSVSENGIVTENLKIMLNVAEGERGLRQSDAVFAHTVNLPVLFEKLGKHHFDAVGVSATPRDSDGSYMPCFLAGVSAATSVSSVCGIPLYKFSHQAGHIAAALYSCGAEELHQGEFIAFHVSGGTTELTYVKDGKITLLGGTKDISAGKAIDRIGVKLGLRFPCGKQLEKLYEDESIDLSAVRTGKICVDGYDCNLSGLENKAEELINKGADNAAVAAYTVAFIAKTLEKMTENVLESYPGLPIIYAGGVMSNRYINKLFTEKFGGRFAGPEFSCDNAAGTARLTELKFNKMI